MLQSAGNIKMQKNAGRRALIAVVLLGLAVFVLTGLSTDLQGPDEGRYVRIARELLGRSNWFILTLHGEPYDEKPPLPFWMFAAMLMAAGGDVQAVVLRLPSILFALLTLAVVFDLGRRRWGERAGLLASLVLLSSAEFFSAAPTVKLDMMFTGWISLSAWAWLTRPPSAARLSPGRAALMWVALAAAVLTKGPLAIIILAAVIGAEAWGRRSWRLLKTARPVTGIVIVGGLVGGWLAIEMSAAGSRFVSSQVGEQTLTRFLEGTHGEPVWYYIPRLFTSIFAPWALVLIPAGALIWKQRRKQSAGPTPAAQTREETDPTPTGVVGGGTELAPLLGWGLVPLVILTLAHGKRQSYLLPLLPAGALLVGWYLDLWIQGRAGQSEEGREESGDRGPGSSVESGAGGARPESGNSEQAAGAEAGGRFVSRAAAAIGLLSWAAGAVLLALGAGVAFRFELAWAHGIYPTRLSALWMGLLGVAFLGAGVWIRRRRKAGVRAAVVQGALALTLLVFLTEGVVVNSALNPGKSARSFARRLDALISSMGVEPIVGGIGKGAKPEYHAYGRYQVRALEDDPEHLRSAVGLPAVLVARAKDWEKLDAAHLLADYTPAAREIASGDSLIIAVLTQPAAEKAALPGRSDETSPTLRFALMGDTGEAPEHLNRIATQIALIHQHTPVTAVFLLGDLIYKHGPSSETIRKYIEGPLAAAFSQGIPVFGVLGNHDLSTGAAPALITHPALHMGGRDYYTVTWGRDLIEFIVLDSETLLGDPAQYLWFRNALATSRARWAVLLLHRPLEASRVAHGASASRSRLLEPLLTGKHDVDLVLSGHNHLYERRTIKDGVVHVTVGTGSENYEKALPDDDGREAQYTDRPGFVVLEVSHERLVLRGINDGGEEFDRAEYMDFDEPIGMKLIARRKPDQPPALN
ncbi:MAG: hypothetical protein Kow0059_12090 [Candidatus Sumerlaeia bacterium]